MLLPGEESVLQNTPALSLQGEKVIMWRFFAAFMNPFIKVKSSVFGGPANVSCYYVS